MKLYEVPKNTWVKLLEHDEGPPGALPTMRQEPVFFHKIDGMYSVCTDIAGNRVHVKGWTEVEPLATIPVTHKSD